MQSTFYKKHKIFRRFTKESSAPICIIKNWFSTRGSIVLPPFPWTEAESAFETAKILEARLSKDNALAVESRLTSISENLLTVESGTEEWAIAYEVECQAKRDHHAASQNCVDIWCDLSAYYLEIICNIEEYRVRLVAKPNTPIADIAALDALILRRYREEEAVSITADDEAALCLEAKIVVELFDPTGNSSASAGSSDSSTMDLSSNSSMEEDDNSSMNDIMGVLGENEHLNEENLLLPQQPVELVFPQPPIGPIFPQVPLEEIRASSDSDNSSVETYMLGTSSYVPSNCYYDVCYGFVWPIVLLRLYLMYK